MPDKKDEVGGVICRRVTPETRRVPQALPGSKQVHCYRCRHAVWIAVSAQRYLSKGARALCVECAVELIAAGKIKETRLPTREALMEDLGLWTRN